MRLDSGCLVGLKNWLVQRVIAWRFVDETPQAHHDQQVNAVLDMVPLAANFDPASPASPRVPPGLMEEVRDVNQVPRFHIGAMKAPCLPRCHDLLTQPRSRPRDHAVAAAAF